MPGVGEHLLREVDDEFGNIVVVAREHGAPSLYLARPGVLLAGGVAERPRHVAHGVLGPIRDDVCDLRGVAPTVLFEDVLDDLFATVGVEVDVDVGLFVSERREKALEGQLVADRVDRRDIEQVADGRVGGRAAALAEDSAAAGVLHDVVHDKEVAGKVFLLDDVELARDAGSHRAVGLGVLVRDGRPDELAQPAHRRVPGRHLLAGKLRFGLAQ